MAIRKVQIFLWQAFWLSFHSRWRFSFSFRVLCVVWVWVCGCLCVYMWVCVVCTCECVLCVHVCVCVYVFIVCVFIVCVCVCVYVYCVCVFILCVCVCVCDAIVVDPAQTWGKGSCIFVYLFWVTFLSGGVCVEHHSYYPVNYPCCRSHDPVREQWWVDSSQQSQHRNDCARYNWSPRGSHHQPWRANHTGK